MIYSQWICWLCDIWYKQFSLIGIFKVQLNERPWSAFCQETCRAFEIVPKAFPLTLSSDNNNLRQESRDVFVDVTVSLLRFKFRVDDIKHFQFPSALFARPYGLSLRSRINITSTKIKFTFMLPCIVIDFFFNNQPDALAVPVATLSKA